MTCSRGTWDDIAADRYAVTHQWLRDSVAIDGKTGADATTSWPPTPAIRSPAQRAPRTSPTRARSTAPRPSARPLNRSCRGSPATRACARRCPARAATGTTRPPTATPSPTAGCATAPRSPARPQPPTPPCAPTSSTNLACRVRAEDLTDATSAEPQHPPARQPRRAARSPATRACSARSPAAAATGTTSPPTATRSPTRGSATASQIPGAAAATYTLTHDDMNKSIYCRVARRGPHRRQQRLASTPTARARSCRRRCPASRTCAAS